MGAAKYVGRVGGLAVALGVGVGILVGAASASADTDDSSSSSASSESRSSQSASSPSASPERASSERVSSERASSESSSSTDSASDGKQRNSIKYKSAGRDEQVDASSESGPETQSDPATAAATSTAATAEEEPGTEKKSKTRPNGSAYAAVQPASEAEATPSEPAAANPGTHSGTPVRAETKDTVTPAVTHVDTDAIGYNPDVTLDNGVITGANSGLIQPYTYTVVRGPSSGGKVSLDSTTGNFTFLPYLSPATTPGTERFSVLVAQQTAFTQALQNIPVVSLLAPQVVLILQQIPIIKDVLSPLIGRAQVFGVAIDVDDYVGADRPPIAFTTRIASFDGTPISVNFFPATGLEFGDDAPTILNGPSLATAGYINLSQPSTVSGLVPGVATVRDAGYNVVTWDPRGEFASGGRMHLDSELYEARDVSAIISWVSGQPGVQNETAGDPLVGMLGGSYGGGIQLTSAGIDSRIDAIAPGIAWNSLKTALYPSNAFKTSWASLLALSLAVTGARPDLEIYAGILTGLFTGFLTPGQQRFLSVNSPDTVVDQITAPTLFLQGTVDGLFVLQQALDNAEQLGADVPVQMIWYCGGHGYCLDLDDDEKAAQTNYLIQQQLTWMDTYVKNKAGGVVPTPGPKFVWVDQNGDWFSANDIPTAGSPFFGPGTITATGGGGFLPIVPFLGESGPQNQAPFPLNLPAAAESRHALEIEIPARPEGSPDVHVVGPPQLTFTYSGLGTSRHIFAQLVDNETHRVLGNLVTPVPVTLDGRTHTVTIDMENIAYTMGAGDSLTLQIVDSASAYEDFTSFGVVNVWDVGVVLPTAAAATPVVVPPAPPSPSSGTPSVEDLLTGAVNR